ncbi:MAG: universal stress protein [Pikeienuella sp.]
MYKKIMVPIDMTHADRLTKAIDTAAALAKSFSSPITCVGITSAAPSSIAHNPAEFEAKLKGFADQQAKRLGVDIDAQAVVTHDPTIDTNDTLIETAGKIGADLVVMQSHVPNVTDYIWASHGGRIASHFSGSVFLVR